MPTTFKSVLQLRDCELKAIVNRDLKQRVRPVSGLVNHKQAIKTYIKLAAKIIQNVDKRWSVWASRDSEKKDEEKEAVNLYSGDDIRNLIIRGSDLLLIVYLGVWSSIPQSCTQRHHRLSS